MRISNGDIVRLRNGALCDVVHQSNFGKWLLVERTDTDELPRTHWHNNNGSFWSDEPSPLDVAEVIAYRRAAPIPVVATDKWVKDEICADVIK